MPCGRLTPEIKAALRPHVEGKVVWDFGSGDFGLSYELLELGAAKVVAVDKGGYRQPAASRIDFIETYFHNLELPPEGIDVAFVSWPVNYATTLPVLLDRARKIVYLGSNTDGNACGSPGLFVLMLCRELLAHVPYHRNSLIVCGERIPKMRPPTPEEQAAFSTQPVRFEDLTKARNAEAETDWDPARALRRLLGDGFP